MPTEEGEEATKAEEIDAHLEELEKSTHRSLRPLTSPRICPS